MLQVVVILRIELKDCGYWCLWYIEMKRVVFHRHCQVAFSDNLVVSKNNNDFTHQPKESSLVRRLVGFSLSLELQSLLQKDRFNEFLYHENLLCATLMSCEKYKKIKKILQNK